MKTLVSIIIIILAVLILIKVTAYTVREGQQVVITQFGRPVRVVEKAGLRFKLPYPIQTVHRLEKRLLPWDGDPENMQTRDKKRIFIDAWARWRIVNPMKFFRAVRTERRGYKILDDLVDSAVRDVVANHNLIEVVRSTNDDLEYETEELAKDMRARQEKISVGRAKMEEQIRAKADENLKDQYGMKLAVVRVKRVNYVQSVRREVYLRMQSERLRIAKLFLSEAEQEQMPKRLSAQDPFAGTHRQPQRPLPSLQLEIKNP